MATEQICSERGEVLKESLIEKEAGMCGRCQAASDQPKDTYLNGEKIPEELPF